MLAGCIFVCFTFKHDKYSCLFLIGATTSVSIMIEKLRDRSSLDAFHESGDIYIREYKIAAMQKRILRDKLRECFLVEGVNHKEKCKDLIDQYTLLALDRFHGMKFPEGKEPVSRVKNGLIIPADYHLKVPN